MRSHHEGATHTWISDALVQWTTPWGVPHQVWVRAEVVPRRTAPAPSGQGTSDARGMTAARFRPQFGPFGG
jgi:hypothetical protein